MSSPIASYCELEPLIADISGGMASHSSLSTLLVQLQEGVNSMSETRRAILKEQTLDKEVITGSSSVKTTRNLNRRARIELDEPSLPDYESKIAPLAAQLEGMVDLDRVVVVVGFGETGKPQNSAFVYNQSTNCQNKDHTGTAEHDGKWKNRAISLWKVASSWRG
jgi:fatty acid synthase subunit alpha